MDPLTAILNAYTATINLIITNIESQPPELRAEIAKQQWEDFRPLREFFVKMFSKHSEKDK